ncbi:hypothetical protein ATOBIA_N15030 [Atopobiaceae bacterium P1]|uniref:Uncharacterized protein n=1 Tax=Leptogranulimonas caecicola TaxID=2894156 RepID=A0AAU9C5U0_9ACTN|nr:hypothetical protein ATOBIA_N15030 [Atopobiaceae bacterium P1]BDC91598.1 hypothetical protein ATTO_14700 [Leptogranulimonas caecicola]
MIQPTLPVRGATYGWDAQIGAAGKSLRWCFWCQKPQYDRCTTLQWKSWMVLAMAAALLALVVLRINDAHKNALAVMMAVRAISV